MEQWARDRRLEPASEALQPIVQAAQLLQARKTDDDVNSVCEMCNKLTANQIVKILNLYTPADDFETRVPVSFIKKVQAKLSERGENNEQVSVNFILNILQFINYINRKIINWKYFLAANGSYVFVSSKISIQSIRYSIRRYRNTGSTSFTHAQKSLIENRNGKN